MNESDFEGTLVLEKLTEMGALDDFYQAVDSDDLTKVITLLVEANFDEETIQVVVNKIIEGDS